MGNRVSQPEKKAKERSDAIDKQIEDDSQKFKRECKVLVLGRLTWFQLLMLDHLNLPTGSYLFRLILFWEVYNYEANAYYP
jgi:hypothetical protein